MHVPWMFERQITINLAKHSHRHPDSQRVMRTGSTDVSGKVRNWAHSMGP